MEKKDGQKQQTKRTLESGKTFYNQKKEQKGRQQNETGIYTETAGSYGSCG